MRKKVPDLPRVDARIYREDFLIKLNLKKLERQLFNLSVKGIYKLNNVSNDEIRWNIPLKLYTNPAGVYDIPIEEYIKLKRILLKSDRENIIDIGAKFGVYELRPSLTKDHRIELELPSPQIPAIRINPLDSVRIDVEYELLTISNKFTYTILFLTKNQELLVDYSDEQFSLEIHSLCSPRMKVIELGHHFKWNGWILPQEGFTIEWKEFPAEITREYQYPIYERYFPLTKLKMALDKYEVLLEKEHLTEEEVRNFLAENWFILDVTAKRVLSKVPLGHEYEVDFLVEGIDFRYKLVEIKKPDVKLFTKKGIETKILRLAKAQMERYQRWITEHLNYFREQFPKIYSPYGLIVIGMSTQLSESEKKCLEQSNITTRGQYEIITYDTLLKRVRNLVENLL